MKLYAVYEGHRQKEQSVECAGWHTLIAVEAPLSMEAQAPAVRSKFGVRLPTINRWGNGRAKLPALAMQRTKDMLDSMRQNSADLPILYLQSETECSIG